MPMNNIHRLKLTLVLPFTFQCGSVPTNECEGVLKDIKITTVAHGNVIKWAGEIQCQNSFLKGEYTATLFNRIIYSEETLSIASTNIPLNDSFYLSAETKSLPVSYSCVTYSKLPPLPALYLKIEPARRETPR